MKFNRPHIPKVRKPDPYQKYRNHEYGDYNRQCIRAIPLVFCFYALYYLELGWSLEFFKKVALLFGFQLLVETLYRWLKQDSYAFSFGVYVAWAWCIYFWLIAEEGDFIEAFLPSTSFLLIIARIVGWYKVVQEREGKSERL